MINISFDGLPGKINALMGRLSSKYSRIIQKKNAERENADQEEGGEPLTREETTLLRSMGKIK